jgi:hypothetical protein
MPFPETLEELKNAGYIFSNQANCRGCGAAIEWFTTPSGKKMPFDVDKDGNIESHFATCPKADTFRKAR